MKTLTCLHIFKYKLGLIRSNSSPIMCNWANTSQTVCDVGPVTLRLNIDLSLCKPIRLFWTPFLLSRIRMNCPHKLFDWLTISCTLTVLHPKLGKKYELDTVCNFHDFSKTQILCEINFGRFERAKSALLTHLKALDFDFYEFFATFQGWNWPKSKIQFLRFP